MELAEELDALGHRNELLAVGEGHEGTSSEELRVLVRSPNQHPGVLLLAARRLRDVLRTTDPDVIVAHGGSAAQVASLASPRPGPALVWQRILGLPSRLGPVRRARVTRVLNRVDAVVALTPRLEAEVRALGFGGLVRVIPNARRTDRFEALDRGRARGELCRDRSIPAERTLVGLVGHLVEQKDPVAAVDGFARLVDRGSDAHLVVVGSGPLAGEVRSAIHRRGLTERTTLLGHVDQVERILGGIDLLWLTSRDEGIPGVLVEAAMAGCPVVTYPVGDVAEVVEHDVTGVVLRAGDPNVLADVTVDLLADRQRLVTMGQRARSESSRWSMDVVVNDYLEVFEAVTGSRQAGSGAAE